MMNAGKKYCITDMQGHFCKLNEKGNLVVAKDSSEATLFSIQQANQWLGTGRRSRFYCIVEATVLAPADSVPESVPDSVPESSLQTAPTPVSDLPVLPDASDVCPAEELSPFAQPTDFDGLQNDWEDILSRLSYMYDHMPAYQMNLNSMLSDVDKEITDIMHYLEFSDLDDPALLRASRMLQERRRKRRQIKDEMDKTALMRSTFLDTAYGVKVQQSLEMMERMKDRQYTPRRLSQLFDHQQRETA